MLDRKSARSCPPLRVKDKEEPIGAYLLTGVVNESTPRP